MGCSATLLYSTLLTLLYSTLSFPGVDESGGEWSGLEVRAGARVYENGFAFAGMVGSRSLSHILVWDRNRNRRRRMCRSALSLL